MTAVVRRILRPKRLRPPRTRFRELRPYRDELLALTFPIDATLRGAADTIDSLRRRAIEPDDGLERLLAAEEELTVAVEALTNMRAPEELHALHLEYEGNVQRARRGMLLAVRGCRLTQLPHRPAEDEEVLGAWKRGHANVLHARLRMRDVVATALHWEPGKPAEVSVATRLDRA